MDEIKSSIFDVTTVVPQRSVLGPLFFSYINQLNFWESSERWIVSIGGQLEGLQ